MLDRIISSSLIAAWNAVRWLAAKTRKSDAKRGAQNQAGSVKPAFVIGQEILDPADVSENPGLGEPVTVTVSQLLQQTYVLGRTGCGKTSLLVVMFEALVRKNATVVVFDARGDLIPRLLSRLLASVGASGLKGRLALIDLPSDWSVPFNVFAGTGTPYSIAEGLIVAIEERLADPLGVTVAEALRAILIALAFGKGRWNLLHVEPMLTNSAFAKDVLKCCDDPVVLGFFERYLTQMTDTQRASLTSAVMNKLTPWLVTPQFRRMVGQGSCIPLRKIIDRSGQVILVNLGIPELPGVGGVLGSMVAGGIIQAAMSRATDSKEGERNPVFLICDEAQNYITKQFHEVIQEGRRMGMGMAVFHQNISQIPAATSDLLMNNCRNMLFFGSGAREASRLSSEIGGEEGFAARSVLTRQQTGQAYALFRGEAARRVKIDYLPDPKVEALKLAELKEQALTEFGRPAKEVDAEIAAELDRVRDMNRGKTEPSKQEAEGVEIRSAKAGRQPRKKGE